ncbi:MAG: DUF1549 domain-containing protein [Nannocystaceae bacterium]|nr:DUF1549 and DUF1553 domain-containing protein [bacterium]
MDTRCALLALALGTASLLGCAKADTAAHPAAQPVPTGPGARPGEPVDPQLDRLIRAGWTHAAITPAPYAEDATYLRRVSLDLTGRIPTAAAVAAFEADDRPNKRALLVDALLESDGFAEHWAALYTDLLLSGRTKLRPQVTADMRAWLHGALRHDTTYDTIATALLTAEGTYDGPGPYGFLASHGDKGNVEALTGKTAQLFLGITLECAQCHDHPSDDRYAQEDFYALGAYFGRTKIRYRQRVASIHDRRRGELHLPTVSDGPGERSGEVIAPGFLSREPTPHPGGRRAALAQDIVASDLFAKTVVARTWQHLFGRGLVPRWDDLGGEHDASHPPALDHLAQRFVEDGYDLHALLRTLVLSDAYQRASSSDRAPEEVAMAEALFAQHPVRSMNADQLFRSLLIATSGDGAGGPLFRKNFEKRRERALREYRFVFNDDEMSSADAFSGSVPQALLLLNGDLVRAGTSDIQGTAVYDVLDRYPAPAARVDALYLRVFGRRPTPAQRDRVLRALGEREHGSSAYEDLMHAMLLSSEFLTIH